MKRSLQHLFLWISSLILLVACGGGGGGGADPAPPPSAATTLRVQVLDVLGFPRAGALVDVVDSGATPVTTGADGQATLELAPGTDALVRVRLAGHTGQFRPVRLASGQSAYLEATVMARAAALALPDAAAGGTLIGRNAARLTLPADALVDAETGAAVTGAVQVEMTPVNTNSHEIRAFPGGMRAVSGDTEGQLVTYGPVEYVFTQGGRKLALAEGRTAVIEMPLHATLDIDGTPLEPGETMPVWSLNETTGLWVQEGEGTVVASASATGLALRATVTHFSWWNPDHFSNARQVNISFVFEDGVTPTVCCNVEGLTTPGFDGPSGLASTTLPVSGGLVVVDTPSLYIFTASGLSEQGPLFGGLLDVSVPEGDGPYNLTITLSVDKNPPDPIITAPEADVTVYTRATLTVQVSVSGGEPDPVELLLASGFVIGPMSGSQDNGYTIAWDTTGLNEGSYQIVVRATGENSVVLSAARTVVVDRTPPQLIGRGPAPGDSEAGAADVVVATFNEPLDPQSLFEAEQLPVRLVSGGVTLPVALALSPDGQTVTATPLAPLASDASYTVFVEGLTDRAGNVMAAEQWSFSVPLWALGSPDLRTPIGADEEGEAKLGNVLGRPEIALASNSEPLVLWRQGTSDGRFNLQAARRIGAQWIALPALQPDGLPNSAFGDQSMALDNSGQPVVAWTQTVPNTAGCNTTQPSQLFVARFNGSAWQTLGAGNLNIEPCALPNLPRLKVDAAGRPVLVSAQGTGGRTIQVLRFQQGDWTLLGTVPVQSVPSLPNVTELRLALDGDLPYVLRSENRSGGISHFVTRLDDAAFVPVGPQVTTGNRNVRGALVIDPQGRPVVAVKAAAEALQVLRFEGNVWQTVGSALAASPFVNEPSIVFEGDEPIVAWREDLQTYVRRYDPVTQDWTPTLSLRSNAGALSELRRLPGGGPIWGALTTGEFRSEMRAVTADNLP